MRFVVFRINNLSIKTSLLFNQVRYPQLLFDPDRDGLPKGLYSHRGISKVCFQKPLKFYKGLIIEGDIIQILAFDVSIHKAVLNSIGGKIEIMLLASEALLLTSCYDLSISDKTSSAVVIKSRDSEDIHRQTL